jgi:hypothetical protein
MIPINLPKIGDEEIEAVVKVMRTGILTTGLGAGPKVAEFEKLYSGSLSFNKFDELNDIYLYSIVFVCFIEFRTKFALFANGFYSFQETLN